MKIKLFKFFLNFSNSTRFSKKVGCNCLDSLFHYINLNFIYLKNILKPEWFKLKWFYNTLPCKINLVKKSHFQEKIQDQFTLIIRFKIEFLKLKKLFLKKNKFLNSTKHKS